MPMPFHLLFLTIIHTVKIKHSFILRNSQRPVFLYPAARCSMQDVFFSRNGSERHSESLHLFLFHGTEFQVVFSSAEGFGTEFREFASILFYKTEFRAVLSSEEGFRMEFRKVSVPRNNRNSVGNNHLFLLIRLPWNYFFVGNSQP